MPLQRSQRPSPELNENDPADNPAARASSPVAKSSRTASNTPRYTTGLERGVLDSGDLVHHDHGAEFVRAGDLVATARGLVAGLAVEAEEILVEHVVDKRALAAPAHTRDTAKNPERQINVDPAQVVFSRAANLDPILRPGRRRAGSGIVLRPVR